jgi:hypothetical protein
MRKMGLGLLARPLVRWGLVALIGVEAAAVAAIYQVARVDMKARQNTVTYGPKAPPFFWKYTNRGLTTPPAIHADASGLDPKEEVVGVVVGGKARAYRLEALRDRDRHVVNDVVGGIPVSVVFCDITNCVRVYTDPNATEPLKVESAGLFDGEMVVKVGENLYMHSTGRPVTAEARPAPNSPPIPYETTAPERVTWGEWRKRHPESDVFVGVPKRVGE